MKSVRDAAGLTGRISEDGQSRILADTAKDVVQSRCRSRKEVRWHTAVERRNVESIGHSARRTRSLVVSATARVLSTSETSTVTSSPSRATCVVLRVMSSGSLNMECPTCNGNGWVWQEKLRKSKGKGKTSVATKVCPDCKGKGSIPITKGK